MNPTLYTNTTAVAADLPKYMARQLLGHAKYQTVLHQFGKREDLPEGEGKTIDFTQYADLDIVVDPLTEGVAPAGKKLQNSAIVATIDQLGDYVTITDLTNITPKHKVMREAYKLLGDQAAKSYDGAINTTLMAGTAVRYAGTATSRATLVAGSKLTWKAVRQEVTRLRNSGATEFNTITSKDPNSGKETTKKGDGNFVLVVDPSVEQDLMDDESFAKAAMAYSNGDKSNEFYTGTIVRFAGVTVVRSNVLKTVMGGAGSALKVHVSLLFGEDAYAVTELQKLKTYKQGPGGLEDPLEQRMTVGWKVGFKSCILNNNWMGRLESVSEY